MFTFNRTLAVINKTIKDLTRMAYWLFVVSQIVFLCLYGFKIYTNINSYFYLTIYVILATLSIFGFVFYIFTYKRKKEKNIIGTKRGVRIIKYLANGVVFFVVAYEFINTEVSDLDIIISLTSLIFFITQIFIEVVRVLYEKYFDLFAIALSKDIAKIQRVSNPKSIIYDAANAPIEAIANKINDDNKKPTKQELYVEELTKEYKLEKKLKNKESIQSKKEKIKENFSLIKKGLTKNKNSKVKKNTEKT